MKICSKRVLKLFPTSNSVFPEAFEPMPSWSFKIEWEVFDGVEIIAAGHVDMKEIILAPYRRICCAVVCLYVYGFEPCWKFMIQHLIGKT